jgi:hypothetical protein
MTTSPNPAWIVVDRRAERRQMIVGEALALCVVGIE